MFYSILAYLLNIIFFICYLIWYRQHTVWPDVFLIWVWIPYILHIYLHHFFDSVQNTTRNIARIYLIKKHGSKYDDKLIEPIQHILIPDSILPITILWQIAHISSFVLILFFQGWGTAIIAEFGLIIFSFIMPLGYQSQLKRLKKNTNSRRSIFLYRLIAAGISPDLLFSIIDQAINEKRNPQRWWAIVLQNAIDEEANKNN